MRAVLLFLLALLARDAVAQSCPVPPLPGTPPLVAPAMGPLRVGIALGSGSMHGLAHIGVLRELEDSGLPVQVVAGTSIGAVIGSLWANGYAAREIESLARGSDWEDVGQLSLSRQGIYSNTGLRDQMEKLHRGRPMQTWPRRFGAVATDIASGERRLLRTGSAAEAVQASAAVPVMFAPVRVNGQALADGALVEPVPVRAAREMGADFVIGVDVAYRPYEEATSGILGFAFQSMHILINRLAEEQVRDADYALRMDLHHAYMHCGEAGVIAAGRNALRQAWPAITAAAKRRQEPTRR
jgi:NTE family protein